MDYVSETESLTNCSKNIPCSQYFKIAFILEIISLRNAYILNYKKYHIRLNLHLNDVKKYRENCRERV